MSSDKEHTVAKCNEPTQLRRSLGLWNIVVLLLSLMGHVAVFITPGFIVKLSGSYVSTLVVWCVASLAVYLMALCFTELATAFQRAGGPYLYVASVFGKLPGFLTAWGYLVLISGPFLAFLSQTASVYILNAITSGADCDGAWFNTCRKLLAGWILVTMTYLNCGYLKAVLRVQNLLTTCKMVATVMIILCGVYFATAKDVDNFETAFEGSHAKPGSLSIAFLLITFSIGGWQALYPLTEEINQPQLVMPRAIHISFAVQVSLCLLTYLSYMVVLDKQEMVSSSAIALLFCRRIYQPLVPLMSALVSLACIGAINSSIMGHSRVFYAAARRGDLPSLFNTLDPKLKTPVMSVMALTLYGLILIYSGGTEDMMQFIGLYSNLMGLKVISALLYLRVTQPHVRYPYRVCTGIIVFEVLLAVSLLILFVYQSPVVMSVGLGLYLSGAPIYIVLVRWAALPKQWTQAVGYFTQLCQKLFLQVP